MFDAGARQFFFVWTGKNVSQTVLQPILICGKTILLGSDNVKTYASVFRAGCPKSLLSAWPGTASVISLVLACAYCVPPTWKCEIARGPCLLHFTSADGGMFARLAQQQFFSACHHGVACRRLVALPPLPVTVWPVVAIVDNEINVMHSANPASTF